MLLPPGQLAAPAFGLPADVDDHGLFGSFSDVDAVSSPLDTLDSFNVADLDSPPMSRPGSPNNDTFGSSFMPADLFRELIDCDVPPPTAPVGKTSFSPLVSIKDTLYTPPQSPTRSPTPSNASKLPVITSAEATMGPSTSFEAFSLDDMDLLMLDDSEISDALLLDGFGGLPALPRPPTVPQQTTAQQMKPASASPTMVPVPVPAPAVEAQAMPQLPKTASQQQGASQKSKGGAKRSKPCPAKKAAPKKISPLAKPAPPRPVQLSSAAIMKSIDGPLDPTNKAHKKTIAALNRAKATEAATEAVRKAQALSNEDPGARRLTHNVLERKRRNDLKNSYQELRECIPEVEENERTPTGQILIKAMEHVTKLKKRDAAMVARVAEVRQENERLRKILAEHGAAPCVPVLPASKALY